MDESAPSVKRERAELAEMSDADVTRDALMQLRRIRVYTQTTAVVLVLSALAGILLFVIALYQLHNLGRPGF